MTALSFVTFRGLLKTPLAVLLCLMLALQMPLQAADLKLEVKLIWGTNDAKPPEPTAKPVDDVTAKKLGNVFKWKNYFEINRKTATLPSRGTQKIVMSDKCALEITELEGPKVEVTLIGDGKRVNKTTKQLNKGEWFTLGGEDKHGSAWFVIVTDLDEKPAGTK